MADRPEIQWKTCVHDGCVGSQLPFDRRCLAHTGPVRRRRELRAFRRGGYLDARGIPVDRRLFRTILAAAPTDDRGRRCLLASFQGATFEDTANFRGVVFREHTSFAAARFHAVAEFSDAVFHGRAALFQARFADRAHFTNTVFEGDALFDQCSFGGLAHFYSATFRRFANFTSAWCDGDLTLSDASFEGSTGLAGLRIRGELNVDDAVFRQRTRIAAIADTVSCRGTQFTAGVVFEVRSAHIVLNDSNLAAPSIITSFADDQSIEDALAQRWDWFRERRGQRPRILSLERADVSGLTVGAVDLSACRFAGAHNLDKLRIEGDGAFPVRHRWPRTARQTLTEEGGSLPPTEVAALYRSIRKGREDNKDTSGAADFYYGEMEMRRRAAREQAGNARRERNWGRWAEARVQHAVLWLYWLISGYALRAWRAVATFAVVVLLGAGLLAFWGFPPAEPGFRPSGVTSTGALAYELTPAASTSGPDQMPTAVRLSFRSATSLLRGPDRSLTPVGEWVETTLRLIGPILLGLAVLSLRGRVMR